VGKRNKYKYVKKMLRPGDVILSLNKENLLSGAIKTVTESNWSHTMMYIGNGLIVESTIGGVRTYPLKHYTTSKYNIAVLRCKDLSDSQRKILIKRVKQYIGMRYAYVQILWDFFLRIIGRSEDPKWQLDVQPNAMMCSEAIARAYGELGFEIKPSFKPAGVEPADFYESLSFVHLYDDTYEG